MTGNKNPVRPSRFGPDDTLGAINLITPEKMVEAARLVKTGKTYSMALVATPNTPGYNLRRYEIHVVAPVNSTGVPLAKNKVTGYDEYISVWGGLGTHLDGLGHVGVDHHYYNGRHANEIYDFAGLKLYGTHALPPIVTRGVMLDIAAWKGVDMMKGGEVITVDDIKATAKAQNTEIRSGDVVVLRTGWVKMLDIDGQAYLSASPGIGLAAAQYLADCGVVIIGADQATTEVHPAEDPETFAPVHQLNLAHNGVYHLQLLTLEDLHKNNVHEFMFCLGLPRLYGATQMVANPFAVV